MAAGDLDAILRSVGQFGFYQALVFVLLGACMLFMAPSGMSYIFTAGDLDYRCRVPECEGNVSRFNPPWLQDAVPQGMGRCVRYETAPGLSESCSNTSFLNSTIQCTDWVFAEERQVILNEWDLMCEENAWKLTLVGTSSCAGQLVGAFFCGLASDRFGRKNVLMWTIVISCIIGMAQTLCNSYITFVVVEFIHNIFGGIVLYSLVYVLGSEIVGPDRRALAAILVPILMGMAETMLGLLAWFVRDWRHLLLIIHGYGFFALTYVWWLPESVRWLVLNDRVEEASIILRRTARFNGIKLTDDDVNKMDITLGDMAKQRVENLPKGSILKQILQSKQILMRLVIVSIICASSSFVYFGLSIQSVSEQLTGNRYVNFMITCAAEIPGCVLLYPLLTSRVGRRKAQCATLLLTGGFCFVYAAVPLDYRFLNIMLFLLGKMASSISFGVLELYAMELFPTELRNSLYGGCFTVGRIGTMLAPQVSLLGQIFLPLPLLMFGSSCTLCAMLALLLPETKDSQFPDTIEEAENIGKTIDCEMIAAS